MEIISSSHMNVEKEIFDPYGRVCCPVILFNVYGFKPFGELVSHHLIRETHWVSGAPDPGYITPETGCHLGLVLFPSSVVSIPPSLISVFPGGGVFSRSVDRPSLASSSGKVLT